MLIKQVKFRIPRTKFVTRIIFVIISILIFQTIFLLRIEFPWKSEKLNVKESNESKKVVDLSYADMDIDDIEDPIIDNIANNLLSEGNVYGFDEEIPREYDKNEINDDTIKENDNSMSDNLNIENKEEISKKQIMNNKTIINIEKEKEKIKEKESKNKTLINEEIKNENKPINISKEEGYKAFQNKTLIKGWRLDEKWEWCRNISIVYTWVNGSDPYHQEKKSKYNGGIKKVDQRDRSMDELRYSLRSLEKNLPWHEGMIYIVSPGQVPYWLNTDHPRIKVIDQATLLPPRVNPTFNSFSIEFYLDKIPGLTERFIQLNDDYFFKRYIHPSFFFNHKKFPNFYYGRTHVHKGFREAYLIARLKIQTSWLMKYWGSIFHTNGVIKEKFGEDDHIIMLQHAPYVWYRDIFEPMRQFYGGYIAQTLSHKFRHPLDLIPTYAHQHYIINVASKADFDLRRQPIKYPKLDFGFYPNKNAEKWITEYGYRPLSKNAVKNYIRFGTVLDDKKKSMKLFNAIKKGPYLMFNLNDDYTTEEPAQWLLDFMNEMFPNKSSFEKD